MTMVPPPPDRLDFTPTAEQLERERALKHFNRLYIYLPVTVVVLFVLGLLALMLVGIFAPGLVGAEEFLSGLADTILVLWMMPMIVFFAIGPIAYLGYLVNRRQRRQKLPPDSPLLQHSRTQMALWKAQNMTRLIEDKTAETSEKITDPLIGLDAFVAYIAAWLDLLLQPFRSENNDDSDGHDHVPR